MKWSVSATDRENDQEALIPRIIAAKLPSEDPRSRPTDSSRLDVCDGRDGTLHAALRYHRAGHLQGLCGLMTKLSFIATGELNIAY